MYGFHFNLCLIVVSFLTSCFVSAEGGGKTNLINAATEGLHAEQTIDFNDVSMVENRAAAQPARRLLRQSFMPNYNSNMGGSQLTHGLAQAPLIRQPLDAPESSASNKVVLVLDNDKTKFSELVQPAEQSLKRLTRNPDAIDDIVGQFQQLGDGMTQQLLQQVSQTAPDMSKSFGQALSEVLAQTNLLAQIVPASLNFSQLRENLGQSNLPGTIDLAQLGQSLSHNFLVGATQNFLSPIRAASEGESGTEATAERGTVGAAAPGAGVDSTQGVDTAGSSQASKNPFVGQSLLPQFSQLPQLNPFGMFAHFPALKPLMPMGSEISEVRVLPEQYSPYKVSPKQVDLQTMAEMRLKAVLKEALTKKTIPILWFHLPSNIKIQKNKEDVEMETKLKIFEQQVIAELKQLQELARMANEVKRAQLQSGAEPTTPLTTKLNLFDIPIYDITLGDIEKTLNDEHVIMLMQTLVQKQNKEFQRHQQATTKYLTDLTGTPIKRQIKTSEETLKTMEKDDMMKMMAYAYRMASMNGHEMPWLKKKNMTNADEPETTKGSSIGQQKLHQFKDASSEMNDEKKWLEHKQLQMTIEAEKQRQMFADTQEKMDQHQMHHWVDPAMMQLQMLLHSRMITPQIQQQMLLQSPMMPPHMLQQMAVQRQMMPPQLQQGMPIERQMMPPQMPLQGQMMPPEMQQPMPEQNQMLNLDMQMQQQDKETKMIQQQDTLRQMMQQDIERRMMPPQIQQEMPVERQMMPPQMPAEGQIMSPQMQQPIPAQNQKFGFEMQMQQQDISRQMMQQQDNTRKMMQQPIRTNFHMELPMPTQRQQQQPMMDLRRPESNAQQFQGHSVEINTPEMKNTTEQKPEPRRLPEVKMPEQTTSFNTEKMPMTKPIPTKENDDEVPKPGQLIDIETPQNQTAKDMRTNNTPTVAAAKLQMPENEGKARFQGIDHFFNKPVFFNHRYHHIGKDKVRPPNNDYYQPDGFRYPPFNGPPPAIPQIYGYTGGYANSHHPPANFHSAASYGHGSKGYGSPYRSATGDEEIAIMLQQHQLQDQQQQQHDFTPKMMMPNNDEFTITTETKNYQNNAEHLIKSHPKRLAKKQTELYKSPAAYIIVVRNNHSKSSKSRRKRSSEYATLEPIDEKSLTALRKVYKNSLKEITLNPNETPAEALMRYNAESIRDALEKVNKQPMEITAGEEDEDEEIKESNSVKDLEHQDAMQQQIFKQAYALSDNGHYVPAITRPEAPANNGPYIILAAGMQQAQPLPVSFNQQPVVVYDPAQEAVYNNMITKYNTPVVYSNNNKFLTQNPFLSIHNPAETLPYLDEYSVVNQPYQFADGPEKSSKFIVYQKSDVQPHLVYNDFTSSLNAINKTPQHISTCGHYIKDYDQNKMWHYDNFVRELPSRKTDYAANKNAHLDAYSHMRQPPIELTNSYRSARSQESSSYEHIIDVIKEELVQCCNTCKDNILKRLDKTLNHQHFEKNRTPYNSFTEKPHTLIYQKPSNYKDFVYKPRLAEMSTKGYDNGQLNKQHPKDYLTDSKINLYVGDEQAFGREKEEIFFKNNQSYRRGTTISEAEVEADRETEVVTAPIESKRKIENLAERDDEELVEEDAEADLEKEEADAKTQKQSNNEDKGETPTTANKEVRQILPEKEKNNLIVKKDTNKKEKLQNLNGDKTIQTAESTTHSLYALRGQFRSYKGKLMPFSQKLGKQFANFKNINKLGSTNSVTKLNIDDNYEHKSDKLEEILNILHDLNKNNKATGQETGMEENASTTISLSYAAATPYPAINNIKASAEDAILTTSNAVNAGKPRKLIHRRKESKIGLKFSKV